MVFNGSMVSIVTRGKVRYRPVSTCTLSGSEECCYITRSLSTQKGNYFYNVFPRKVRSELTSVVSGVGCDAINLRSISGSIKLSVSRNQTGGGGVQSVCVTKISIRSLIMSSPLPFGSWIDSPLTLIATHNKNVLSPSKLTACMSVM